MNAPPRRSSGRLWSSVCVGLGALRHNRLRTFLSALGVVIGVGALVSVLSLGDGMERFARNQIVSTSSLQNVSISPRTFDEIDGVPVERAEWTPLTTEDALAARRELAGMAGVMMTVSGTSTARLEEGGRPYGMRVTAILDGAERFFGLEMAAGRFLTAGEVADTAAVAVVSHSFVERMAPGAEPAALLGRTIRMRDGVRTIVGVLARPTIGGDALAAYVPLTAADRALAAGERARPRTLLVQAPAIEELRGARDAVRAWMAARHGPAWGDDYLVQIDENRGEQLRRGILVFKLFLGSIAAISLLVGGIGIMNVLLASVTERTREIGIRKAVGARRGDIVLQFLAESVAITGAGSAAGLLLGVAVAFGVTSGMRATVEVPVHAAVSLSTLAVAALSAIVIGISFGTYPALRASRLSPIDAIRHE